MKFNLRNIFRQKKIEKKESRTQPLLALGGDVIWSEKNYETFAKEAYLRNVISFACIDKIAKAVSSVPWKIFEISQNGKRTEVLSHPLRSIIKRPNPDDSFNYLVLKLIAYLCISGNSFMERVGTLTGGDAVKEFYVLRPDRMQILQSTSGAVTGYRYSANGRSVDFVRDAATKKSEILHLKTFNPINDWWGAAVTESASYEIDTSNEMTTWNMGILQNQARPGMLFLSKNNLTDEQWTRLKKQLLDNKSSGKNAGRNLILEGTDDVKPYAWSPAELDYIEGGRELARRIAIAYNVPPMLLSIPGDNTYSNFQEARLAFQEETVNFYLTYLSGELNNWLFGAEEENIFLAPVLDDVPALAVKRDALWKRANDSNFLTTNEKRAMVGIDTIGDEGESILVPANMIPLGMEIDIDETTPDNEMNNNDEENNNENSRSNSE